MFAIVGMALVFVLWQGPAGLDDWFSSGEPTPSPRRSSRSTAADDAQCQQDIQCWGDKHAGPAIAYCVQQIESLAQYAHEWTHGRLDPTFSHYRWLDQRAGHVTYIGDRLRFQNGFGAWQPVVYECDFDPINDRVLEARASEGRLPAQ